MTAANMEDCYNAFVAVFPSIIWPGGQRYGQKNTPKNIVLPFFLYSQKPLVVFSNLSPTFWLFAPLQLCLSSSASAFYTPSIDWCDAAETFIDTTALEACAPCDGWLNNWCQHNFPHNNPMTLAVCGQNWWQPFLKRSTNSFATKTCHFLTNAKNFGNPCRMASQDFDKW